MLTDALKELRALNLGAMAVRLEQWVSDPANRGKSIAECVLALAQAHLQAKATNRVRCFFRRAGLPESMSVEHVWIGPDRGLTSRTLGDLSSCDWVRQGQTVAITGESRVGKTYLAASLAREAVLANYSVEYCRTSELLERLATNGPGNLAYLKRVRHAKLLVLDDFAMVHATSDQCQLLFDLLDWRKRNAKAVIVASPNVIDEWRDYFESKTLASVIFGRLLERTDPTELKRGAPKARPTR